MASRAQQAASADAKALRAAALAILEGQPLPLPTEPRTEPATYSDDLPAEAMLLGSQGLTTAQIAAHWAVDVQALKTWGEAHPALKAALSRARTAAQAWWEERARRAIITGDNRFPAGAWSQMMRAQFTDYDDKGHVHVHLDIAQLVHVHRNAPELPTEQTAQPANPLINITPVRQVEGQTLEQRSDQGSQAGGSLPDGQGEG